MREELLRWEYLGVCAIMGGMLLFPLDHRLDEGRVASVLQTGPPSAWYTQNTYLLDRLVSESRQWDRRPGRTTASRHHVLCDTGQRVHGRRLMSKG